MWQRLFEIIVSRMLYPMTHTFEFTLPLCKACFVFPESVTIGFLNMTWDKSRALGMYGSNVLTNSDFLKIDFFRERKGE